MFAIFNKNNTKNTKSVHCFKTSLAAVSIVSVSAALLFANPAMAEGRYSFEKEGNAILRFDNQTGQIDQCLVESGAVKCTLSNDDRVKLETEIANLKQKIADLEAGKDKSAMPDKKNIDQAFDMMQYFMQKFQKLADDDEPTTMPQKL